jgi:hypothetical protein
MRRETVEPRRDHLSNAGAAVGKANGNWLTVLVAGGLAGLVAAWCGDALSALVVVAGISALLVGAVRPRLLIPLLAAGVVLVPPFVGWLTPTGFYLNLLRAVVYAGAAGLAIWIAAGRNGAASGELRTAGVESSTRWALFLLCGGWLLTVVLGLSHGVGNSLRTMNAVLYQAFPLWLGARFAREYRGLGLLQLSFFGLLLYSSFFCVYEVWSGQSIFAQYVPPIPELMSSANAMVREGRVRAEATFGQPLAFDQFLLLATPIATSLVFTRGVRLLGVLALLVGAAALLATGSRSPWVAILAGSLAFFAVRRPRFVLVGLALLVAVGGTLPAIRQAVGSLPRALAGRAVTEGYSQSTEMEYSVVGRLVATVAAVRAVRDRPIAGYGVHGAATAAGIPTVDNYFLRLPVEVGLPAAVLTIAGVILLWWSLARRPCLTRDVRLVLVGLAMYLAQLLFVGLVETLPLFFLVLGFVTGKVGFRYHREAHTHAASR